MARKNLVGLYPGESVTQHFGQSVDTAHDDKKHAVHNGMNEEPDIPRFGQDDLDY